MADAVRSHDEKKVRKKGNNRTRPYKLSVEDQILMTLMYYREYRTHFHIGETYDIHETNVSRIIRRIEKILKKSKEFKLPGKKILTESNDEYEVILVDATESPIERPKKSSTYITQGKRKSTPSKRKSLLTEKQGG